MQQRGETLEGDIQGPEFIARQVQSCSLRESAGFEQGSQFVADCAQDGDGTPGHGLLAGEMGKIALDDAINALQAALIEWDGG